MIRYDNRVTKTHKFHLFRQFFRLKTVIIIFMYKRD